MRKGFQVKRVSRQRAWIILGSSLFVVGTAVLLYSSLVLENSLTSESPPRIILPQIVLGATTKKSALLPGQRVDPFTRLKLQVMMPDDLVNNLKTKEPALARWVDTWEAQRPPTVEQLQQLQVILDGTSLSASDLWRLTRQLDRGGDPLTCSYCAAAAVTHAAAEMASKNVTIDASYVHEFSNLRVFLLVCPHHEALAQWAELLLQMPADFRTAQMESGARIALAIAKFKEHDAAEAQKLLDGVNADALSGSLTLSQTDHNEIHLLQGTIDDQNRQYPQALAEYRAIPVDGADYDNLRSASILAVFALAKMGDRQHALQELGTYINRYKLSDSEIRELAERLENVFQPPPS